MSTANSKQVAGSHYKTTGIQHWDLVVQNEVPYLEGCATKYLTRFRKKNGLQDLEKSLHYTEKLIEVNINVKRNWDTVDAAVLGTFLADNSVVGPEREPIRLLLNWRSANDLKVAKVWIETMIAEYDGSAPGPGYVNQDR